MKYIVKELKEKKKNIIQMKLNNVGRNYEKSNQAKILELKKTNEMKTWLEFQQQI